MDEVRLTRSDKPERKYFENPFTWWKGTPFYWNREVPIWTGSGEAEALCELFFDNLASLLGVTGACVGTLGAIISFNDGINAVAPGYGPAIAKQWESMYFNRNIPGTAFALLFGNAFYSWQCGRLAAKEGRTDVTAQPYGVNTTGIYICTFAVQLECLFWGAFKFAEEANGDLDGAAYKAADFAWKVSVSSNFLMGLFEMLGAFIGEAIRKVTPTAAFYSPLLGVGFVFLAFSPMLSVAAEPLMCLVPLLIVMVGYFGGVRYTVFRKLTIPIALLAIVWATVSGWAGACKRRGGSLGAEAYTSSMYIGQYYEASYDTVSGAISTGQYFDSDYVTCVGSSRKDLDKAWTNYAGSSDLMSNAVFVGLAGFGELGNFMTTLFLVAMVSFTGTMASVESASAAGDEYPMAETMLVDGAGTCIGALFGSYFSTTVYIGHPIHKALGAKRGYSLVNGLLYFVVLLSGIFASVYRAIPTCANGAMLIFVGLLLGRQAFEETPSKHYPALLLSTFPYLANWAKLHVQDEGIKMMGQAGGLITSFFLTWVFCHCIDRKFTHLTILAFILIWLSLFGFFASHNAAGELNDNNIALLGDEKVGWYPKKDHDYNNGWRWAVAWTLAFFYFAVHIPLQKSGYIKAEESEKGKEEGETTPDNKEAESAAQ